MSSLFKKLRISEQVLIAGTTGKSARRLKEVINEPDVNPLTVAKAYGKTYTGIDEVDSLEGYDYFIIDESSMLSLNDAYKVEKKYSIARTLILVGDPVQLPPIASENIFKEFVRTLKNTPLYLCLTKVYRFSQDFKRHLVIVKDRRYVKNYVRRIVENIISRGIRRWKVATNYHRDKYMGTQILNSVLREVYHGASFSEKFVPGDIVLICSNHYDRKSGELEAANKEEGKIIKVIREKKEYLVDLGDKPTTVPEKHLEYGYAVECRTAQGCEYDAFVFVAGRHDFEENLWYTMSTRGKKEFWLVVPQDVYNRFDEDLKKEINESFIDTKFAWRALS